MVALANIDSAMEESAQNLGASGFRLFRRIVFPLAMPGYLAGAALVFLKVFDDVGTPLVLNVTNILAAAGVFPHHVDRHRRPDRLRCERIMVIASLDRGMGLDLAHARQGLRHAAARRLQSRAAQVETVAGGHAYGWIGLVLLVVLSPHLGILLLSLPRCGASRIVPDVYTLAQLRDDIPRLDRHDGQHAALLRDRRRIST